MLLKLHLDILMKTLFYRLILQYYDQQPDLHRRLHLFELTRVFVTMTKMTLTVIFWVWVCSFYLYAFWLFCGVFVAAACGVVFFHCRCWCHRPGWVSFARPSPPPDPSSSSSCALSSCRRFSSSLCVVCYYCQ